MSDSLRPHRLATRLLPPWDSPGKNSGVGCHFLLQGIFPTQGLNLGLPHCTQMFYHLSHQGKNANPVIMTNLGIRRLLWWLNGKESACQCRRRGFDLWVRKIAWRRSWQPCILTWEILWTEEVGRLPFIGVQRVRHNLVTKQQ